MGTKGVSILVVLLAAITYYGYHKIASPVPAPKLPVDKYWGPSGRKDRTDAAGVHLQKIQFPIEVINELRDHLNGTRQLHSPLEGVGFQYGFNKHKLEEILTYWKDDYLPRWTEREAYLNSLPHFLAEIQGLRIHFIHTKEQYNTKAKTVIPLLLIHGWPGSVREFYDIIPKLAAPKNEDDIAFVVVAPSLPGYGWSDGASIPGLGAAEMAVVLRNLMIKLGYQKFLVQGGDWGSLIGSTIATLFPENVIGFHSNFCWVQSPFSLLQEYVASFYPSLFIPAEYEDFIFPLSEKYKNLMEESGYFHIQSTKPDTIGTVLSHNPVGLAAYILEKFSTWTNINNRLRKDGGLDKDFTKDALLDNIMIYYLTNSITTSVRLYTESFTIRHLSLQLDRVPTKVPVGCARFKHELSNQLDWSLRNKFKNLVHSTYHLQGGHFAAMQKPDVLYKDFVEFVKKIV